MVIFKSKGFKILACLLKSKSHVLGSVGIRSDGKKLAAKFVKSVGWKADGKSDVAWFLDETTASDKDAVNASMLICEMTAYYKAKGMTLSDALNLLFEKYGYCYETNRELYMEGVDGPEKMANLMNGLRYNPPKSFGGSTVITVGDYQAQTITKNGVSEPTGLPSSNVLSYELDNGDVIVVRPSGTEPKVKFYYLMLAKDQADAEAKLEGYLKVINSYIEG